MQLTDNKNIKILAGNKKFKKKTFKIFDEEACNFLETLSNEILKDNNDGFLISEEDMKLRGFGDILGFKQSGIKNFKLADPIHNSDLFKLAEKEMKRIEKSNEDISKFKPLIKLYDRADIINDIA